MVRNATAAWQRVAVRTRTVKNSGWEAASPARRNVSRPEVIYEDTNSTAAVIVDGGAGNGSQGWLAGSLVQGNLLMLAPVRNGKPWRLTYLIIWGCDAMRQLTSTWLVCSTAVTNGWSKREDNAIQTERADW